MIVDICLTFWGSGELGEKVVIFLAGAGFLGKIEKNAGKYEKKYENIKVFLKWTSFWCSVWCSWYCIIEM